jgi:hypothetical protein
MVRISCNQNCRYLEGVSYQQKRLEDREFSELMGGVGHGQHDDIFQQPDVAMVAFEIESLVRDFYVKGSLQITDTSVYEAYKAVYRILFQNGGKEGGQLDELSAVLL